MTGPRFELVAQNRVRVFKTPCVEEATKWTDELSRISMMRSVDEDYDIYPDQELGMGCFAVVYKGKCKLDEEIVAVKVINKTKLSKYERECMFREITILKTVKHQTLVGLHDVYETSRDLYLVLEHVPGEQLLQRLEDEGAVEDANASYIARQILSGMHYLHSNAIVHRDLKLSNIMYKAKGSYSIKILDFGYSTYARQAGDLSVPVGTIKYFAPEICKGESYGKEVDMWAFGVIMYALTTAGFPFNVKNDDQEMLLQAIKSGRYDVADRDYKKLADKLKDLLRRVFKANPKDRITVEEALVHEWVERSMRGQTTVK